MEFEYNFYAIVREVDSSVGVIELLVDKRTCDVGPAMGPNMMWNAEHGVHDHGRTMGSTNALTPEEALETAQRWLDANQPGTLLLLHFPLGKAWAHFRPGGALSRLL